MRIDIDTDMTYLVKKLGRFSSFSLPHAASNTLTALVEAAQGELKSALPRYFTIRNRFTEGGIRIVRAKASTWPFTSAIVGSISPYLGIQTTGGDKTSKMQYVGAPIEARPTQSAIIPRNFRTPNLIKSGNPLGGTVQLKKGYAITRGKNGKMFLIKKANSKKSTSDTVLYQLKKSVHIKKRFPLEELTRAVFNSNISKVFKNAFNELESN